jgi:hypothetical protein
MRDILDEAIGAPPASTVDIDRVVAAGRRRTRLRRLAMASPVVPAVAAVALAVTTLGGSPAAPTNPIPLQPGAATGAASGAAPVYDETPEQTQERLATALADALTAALPGVTLTDAPSGDPGVVVTMYDDPLRYEGSVILAADSDENQLSIRSLPGGPEPTPTTPASGQAVWTQWYDSCADVPSADEESPEGYTLTTECDESLGADGQTIVVVSTVCDDCPGQPTLRRDVYVTWTNARVLVAITNALKSDQPGTTSLAELLLTKEQLVAIASDPQLTVAA